VPSPNRSESLARQNSVVDLEDRVVGLAEAFAVHEGPAQSSLPVMRNPMARKDCPAVHLLPRTGASSTKDIRTGPSAVAASAEASVLTPAVPRRDLARNPVLAHGWAGSHHGSARGYAGTPRGAGILAEAGAA